MHLTINQSTLRVLFRYSSGTHRVLIGYSSGAHQPSAAISASRKVTGGSSGRLVGPRSFALFRYQQRHRDGSFVIVV